MSYRHFTLNSKKQREVLWLTDPADLLNGYLPLELPDYRGLIKERLAKLPDALKSPKFREQEKQRCKESLVYWVTYYGWIYNPWQPEPNDKIPFIPMPFQEEFLLSWQDALYRCNHPTDYCRENWAVPKCRETAGSWSWITGQAWDWQFHQGSHLILSRKKEEVDDVGNMDTPFEKIRFLLRHQPDWLLPEGFEWHKHSRRFGLTNPNGGFIGGDAMSPSAGAGGRVRSILFDEFAKVVKATGNDYAAWKSCQNTSNFKGAVSTPEGSSGKFYDLVHGEGGEGCRVFWFNWWKDPRKMQNARVINGKPESPWNDECKPGTGRDGAMDKQSYASQVDCSFQDSVIGGIYSSQYNKFHQVEALQPVPGEKVWIQIDPGAHFFWLVTQILECGCYLCFKEDYIPYGDIAEIGESINRYLNQNFPYHERKFVGDPAGAHVKSSRDANKSEFTWLSENCFKQPVWYDFMFKIPREEWIDRGHLACRTRMTQICSVHRRSKFLIDIKQCKILHQALSGAYREKVGPDGKPTGVVEQKHPIEDAADAFKYGPLAAGLHMPGQTYGLKAPPPAHDKGWMKPSQLPRRHR